MKEKLLIITYNIVIKFQEKTLSNAIELLC
ncbi:MAG: hypothetical protein ACI94Y_001547 [Maribacter sp.]|jgi:hypothetical protein